MLDIQCVKSKNDRKIDRFAPKKQIKNVETPKNPTLVHIENLGKSHTTETLIKWHGGTKNCSRN